MAAGEEEVVRGGFQFTPLPCPILGNIRSKSKDTLELFDKW